MNYYYLVSSLPFLQFSEKSPISIDEFMSNCSAELKIDLFKALESVSLIPGNTMSCDAEEKWNAFETNLRNFIVRTRTHKTAHDPESFIREDSGVFANMERDVEAAFDSSNPLIVEEKLDALRWRELDNLKGTHEFDFDVLFIYKIRLMLMDKWQNLEDEKGQSKLDCTVEDILKKETEK